MKHVCIGDIHGRTSWKDIVQKETFDKIVFIGDYFDSKEGISALNQIENFNEIIDFKKSNPEKVILLTGNHDYHYLKYVYQTYNGFQAFDQPKIQPLIQEAYEEDLIQMAYCWDSFLFTHARVTKEWFRNNFREDHIVSTPIEILLNNLFKQRPTAYCFLIGSEYSPTGNSIYQSPIWVRPDSLMSYPIPGYKQVVGHTVKQQIEMLGDFTFIDTLGTSGEYLVIENEEILIKRIK
jgi:predicted MPP superfamily phosphohydrolase